MNCQEYQDWMQRRLDGDASATTETGVEQHRASCPACAGLDDAAQRLERGLRLLAAPTAPPERLADAIVYQVLSQRRAARRRILVYAAAMAACLLLGFYLGKRSPETKAPAPPVPREVAKEEPQRPKLNQKVGEAGTAVASLVSRTADQAMGQGRLLLPETASPMPMPAVDPWAQTIEPPAQSLYDAGQGVSAGLEPVASSAKRAVNMFLRDIPPVAQGLQ
jgi:hypothetical protein